jgi:hypothetical protein
MGVHLVTETGAGALESLTVSAHICPSVSQRNIASNVVGFAVPFAS